MLKGKKFDAFTLTQLPQIGIFNNLIRMEGKMI